MRKILYLKLDQSQTFSNLTTPQTESSATYRCFGNNMIDSWADLLCFLCAEYIDT